MYRRSIILIIDTHVHIGRWLHPVYKNMKTNLEDYLNQSWFYKNNGIISGALLLTSPEKDHDGLIETLKTIPRYNLAVAYWYDPYAENDVDISKVNSFKVHAGIDRIPQGIANELYSPLMKLAMDHNKPIIVHTGAWRLTSDYNYVVEIAKKYPDVTFVAAHCGAHRDDRQFNAIRAFGPYENILVDTSSVKYSNVIKEAYKKLGAKRILFGSDWPIMSPVVALAAVKEGIPQDDIEQVLGLNAIDVFNLKFGNN